ncbi:hypothetical protein [Mycolicibacter minnesotensis]
MNADRRAGLAVAVVAIAAVAACLAYHYSDGDNDQLNQLLWSGVYGLCVVGIFASGHVLRAALRSVPVKVARAWIAFVVLLLTAMMTIFSTTWVVLDYAYPIGG